MDNPNDQTPAEKDKNELILPDFPELEEVPLTPSLRDSLRKGSTSSPIFNSPNITYTGVRYFVSDAALIVVCRNINEALKADGYHTISAKTTLNSGGMLPTYGAYTKPGGSDLLISVSYGKKVLESLQEKPRTNDDPMLEFMIPLEKKKYAIIVIGARGMAPSLGRFINKNFK